MQGVGVEEKKPRRIQKPGDLKISKLDEACIVGHAIDVDAVAISRVEAEDLLQWLTRAIIWLKQEEEPKPKKVRKPFTRRKVKDGE